MPASGTTVFIVDDITTKPGAGEAFLEAYERRYVPGAEARGLTLLHRLVSPPVWLPDQANRLMFIWTAAGAAGAWAAKLAGRPDLLVAEWWQGEAAALIESRTRGVYAKPADIAELNHV